MDFLVAVETGDENSAYGVVVPGLPGCFSAGDTYEEALANAREAIELHIEALLDAGETIPKANTEVLIKEVKASKDYQGWLLSMVGVSPEVLDETIERINISIPRRVLFAIDRAAQTARMNRSAFLSQAGLRAASHRKEDEGSAG